MGRYAGPKHGYHRRPDWSQLLSELLSHILRGLAHPDCLNFGQVCKSWRSVFLARCRVTKPQPCMFFTPFSAIVSVPLWGLHQDELFKIRSPVLEFALEERIIGSSMGWLVVGSVKTFSMNLVNPISFQRIPLSSKASDGTRLWSGLPGDRIFTVGHVVLSSAPTTRDCIIVARGHYSHHNLHGYAYCRLGDTEWNLMPWSVRIDCKDMMFHKGSLYVVGHAGDFSVYTFDSQPRNTDKGLVTTTISNLENWQLVESGGEILSFAEYNGTFEDRRFYIFKRDHSGTWIIVENLGDWVLLQGRLGSVSFDTRDIMGSGFEANCIYYQSRSRTCLSKTSLTSGRSDIIFFPRGIEYALQGIDWVSPSSW